MQADIIDGTASFRFINNGSVVTIVVFSYELKQINVTIDKGQFYDLHPEAKFIFDGRLYRLSACVLAERSKLYVELREPDLARGLIRVLWADGADTPFKVGGKVAVVVNPPVVYLAQQVIGLRLGYDVRVIEVGRGWIKVACFKS